MKKTLILITLLIAGITVYGQKVALTLNLVQGQTYYNTSSSKLLIVETINGQQMNIVTTIGGKVAHKVTAVKDSVYEMEVSFQSMAMHIEIMDKVIDFNSEKKDENDVFSKIMATMINKPFLMTLSNRGRVLAINNIENLYTHAFDNFPQVTEEKRKQVAAQLKQAFGPESLKGNMEESFAFSPDNKVAVNDKWVVNTALKSAISVNIKTTYTLKEITANAYLVHGDGAMTSKRDSEYGIVTGMPVRLIDGTGTVLAELKLDKATGWVTESKITKIVKGIMDIKDNPKVPGGMQMPISVDVEINTTGN
jgi:hypothetical protein